MRKRWMNAVFFSLVVLFAAQSASAGPQHVADDFMNALIKNGRRSGETYLLNSMVTIPDLKDNGRIGKWIVLPTPQKVDTQVVVGFFQGEVGGERVAFVWELVVKDDKISQINILHDGMNPLMEEAKLVKAFELKFQRNVIVPVNIPFAVSGFDGYMDEVNEGLFMYYRGESINGYLRVSVVPVVRDLTFFKAGLGKLITLKGGRKALYRPSKHLADELLFQHDGLQYTISFGHKKYLTKKFTQDDLIHVAESMH